MLPVISRQRARDWTDPRDATSGGIDLRRIAGWGREYQGGAGGWELGLATRPNHPGDRGSWRAMLFQFLDNRPEPCTPFGPRAAFYAYATLRDGGEVAAWDFAPDHAWLPMVPRHGQYLTRGQGRGARGGS